MSRSFGCLGNTCYESLRQQVGISCFGLAFLVLIVVQHMLSMPSSGFVHFSVPTSNALYNHTQSIASALSVRSFVHLALFSFYSRLTLSSQVKPYLTAFWALHVSGHRAIFSVLWTSTAVKMQKDHICLKSHSLISITRR